MRYIALQDTTCGSMFVRAGSIVEGKELDILYPKVFKKQESVADEKEALIAEITKRVTAEVLKKIKADK